MKKLLFALIVLLSFISCSTPPTTTPIYYVIESDNPDNGISIELLGTEISDYWMNVHARVEDNFSKSKGIAGLKIRIVNNTSSVAKIKWDSSSINGSTVFVDGMRYEDHGRVPPLSVIAPNEGIIKDVSSSKQIYSEYDTTSKKDAWKMHALYLPVQLLLCIESSGIETYYRIKVSTTEFSRPPSANPVQSENDYPTGLILYAGWNDKNNDKKISNDELKSLGKVAYDLATEDLCVAFFIPNNTGEVIFQTKTISGELIGETKENLENKIILFYTNNSMADSNGDFLDRLSARGKGEYEILAIFNGKIYSQVISIH